MTIAIDASRANKVQRTGVEWYSYFLIQELKKIMPADTRVVLYVQSEPLADLLPLPQNWKIKILRWPLRFWTIFRLSWEMLLHKPDIFFSPANILPFFTPKKTFTTIHDLGFKRFPECYSAGERWLQNFGVKRALKKSNTPLREGSPLRSASFAGQAAGQAIFVPSEFTKKELVEVYGADAQKIIVTTLGCPPLSLDKERQGEVGIKKPYFIFIGRKDAKKNIPGIIHAFKIFSEKNPGYSLVLAGPLSTNFSISQFPNIFLLDWISSQEKQILLQNAEALVFPSFYEGFGLPILEAFATGVPVITSNTCSMPEVAGDAAILVDPKNPNNIAGAMEKIAKNPELKNQLVAAGRERLKNFSWQKCAEDTLNFILKKSG